MWKIMTVRVNYYTNEETLVWFKDPWDLSAACKIMELMGVTAANFHEFHENE